MRIISGKFRGKKILAPQSLPVRPTTDFAKTGLFNMLNQRLSLEGAAVLDLYAGTGNISYELISRGAGSLIAVDADKHCVAFIDKTFKLLQASLAQACRDDAISFLEMCNQSFDLIFADPPYEHSPVEQIVELVMQKRLLNSNGLLVIEHSSKKNYRQHQNLLIDRKYGAVAFSIFVADKIKHE